MIRNWYYKIQKQWAWTSATVIGPAHEKEGKANQDAVHTEATENYWLGVVCDGMGSAKYGGEGASMATKAVSQAVGLWENGSSKEQRLLLKLIISLWRNQIPSNSAYKDFNTTCLFCLLRNDGSGLLAQLGDGMILRVGTKEATILTPTKAFGNQTEALGSIRSLDEWQVMPFENFEKNTAVLLTTDGVSDDLLEGEEANFTRELVASLMKKCAWNRKSALTKLLKNWFTPKHTDDKTICLIWHKKQKNESTG